MLYLSPLPPSCRRIGSDVFRCVRGFSVFLASSARPACASSFCFRSAVRLRSIFGLAAVANRSVKPTRLRRAAYFLSLGLVSHTARSSAMQKTTKLRLIGGVVLLFNLWLIGRYNLQGIPVLLLTFGFAFGYEFLVVRPAKPKSGSESDK